LSRAIDPIFAVSVGALAAVVRINREEKEKGRSTDQTIASLKRRTMALFQETKDDTKQVVEKAR
jgi:cell division protein FtsB